MTTKKVTKTTVDLTEEAKARLEPIRKEHGMSQKSMLERLVDWFAMQPRNLRSVILDQVDGEAKRDLLLHLVRDLEEEKRFEAAKKKSAAKALRVITDTYRSRPRSGTPEDASRDAAAADARSQNAEPKRKRRKGGGASS